MPKDLSPRYYRKKHRKASKKDPQKTFLKKDKI